MLTTRRPRKYLLALCAWPLPVTPVTYVLIVAAAIEAVNHFTLQTNEHSQPYTATFHVRIFCYKPTNSQYRTRQVLEEMKIVPPSTSHLLAPLISPGLSLVFTPLPDLSCKLEPDINPWHHKRAQESFSAIPPPQQLERATPPAAYRPVQIPQVLPCAEFKTPPAGGHGARLLVTPPASSTSSSTSETGGTPSTSKSSTMTKDAKDDQHSLSKSQRQRARKEAKREIERLQERIKEEQAKLVAPPFKKQKKHK